MKTFFPVKSTNIKPASLRDDQELLQSESTFQKSLSNISAESSNAAVEVASLKAMLQVEQSKVGWVALRSQKRVAGSRNFWENLRIWWISISELLHLGLWFPEKPVCFGRWKGCFPELSIVYIRFLLNCLSMGNRERPSKHHTLLDEYIVQPQFIISIQVQRSCFCHFLHPRQNLPPTSFPPWLQSNSPFLGGKTPERQLYQSHVCWSQVENWTTKSWDFRSAFGWSGVWVSELVSWG